MAPKLKFSAAVAATTPKPPVLLWERGPGGGEAAPVLVVVFIVVFFAAADVRGIGRRGCLAPSGTTQVDCECFPAPGKRHKFW